ncbi:MAG: hypothetical protein SNJ56_04650 [Termitinemataceae bacterium]
MKNTGSNTPFPDSPVVLSLQERQQGLSLKLFSSTDLFTVGLLCIPALVFGSSIPAKLVFLLYFYVFAWLQGKRNNIFITGLVMAGIIGFNLLIPYGRVLLYVGIIPITEGALKTGFDKAITLESLIMLSKVSIRSDLVIPGRYGRLIGASFQLFERFLEQKNLFTIKHPIKSIDTILFELSGFEITPSTYSQDAHKRRPWIGRLILTVQVLSIWLLWIYFNTNLIK